MPEKIIDLHIHSRYSRACSKELNLPNIATACEQKGIDIVVTGDFTHPAWIEHIKENLLEERPGIYQLSSRAKSTACRLKLQRWRRDPLTPESKGFLHSPAAAGSVGMTGGVSPTRFILGTEISCIYKDKDATRRVHLLILAPSIRSVEKFNSVLVERGVNIRADGRPIMGLSAKSILQILLDIDPGFMLIPAHAWTPWFGILGSKSGYDRIEDCFEELAPHIRAIETGLSSDPAMNHRLSALDNITLVSNSDAHSLDKLGREANVLDLSNSYDYSEITDALKAGNRKKFLYTIEFYPEEGKYHFDGHAECEVCLSPAETKQNKFLCPKCKKKVTVGVLHRVDDLADRPEADFKPDNFIPHKYIVPLKEIIAKVFGVGVGSKKVAREYENLIKKIGSEFSILVHTDLSDISKVASDIAVAKAIGNMRTGNIRVKPGYDGIFGSVEVNSESIQNNETQAGLL